MNPIFLSPPIDKQEGRLGSLYSYTGGLVNTYNRPTLLIRNAFSVINRKFCSIANISKKVVEDKETKSK